MKLFPYSLIRVGGETFDNWSQLEVDQLSEFSSELSKLYEKREQFKEKLCDDLMSFIQSSSDQLVQNAVQNVRRDIFNGRKLKNSKLNKAKEVLPDNLNADLSDFLKSAEVIKEKLSLGKEVYLETLIENRKKFQELVDGDTIKKGLVLSSRSLLDRLKSYKSKEVSAFRKKEMQTEISLLQYMTRMYAKTSPFSTFTNLSVVENGDKVENIELKHDDNLDELIGHIRLNNYLFKYLSDLFTSYQPLYHKLTVRNNPTIKKEDESYLYLTNNNNVEAFQRIPQNPVVEYIYELVSADKVGIQFNELVEQLLEAIEAEKPEIEDYVKQLIDYGFLEYKLGVSGIDPDWDEALIKVLTPLKDITHVSELIDVLIELRKLSLDYANAPSADRGDILQKAFDIFKEICLKIHEEAGLPEDERKSQEELREIQKQKAEEAKKKEEEDKKKTEEGAEVEEAEKEEEEVVFKKQSSTYFNFKPEQVFYEDTTRQLNATVQNDKMTAIIQTLDDVLKEMKIFKSANVEKENMIKYFQGKYGDDTSVDLLTFYEDYFKEFKKPEKEKAQKLEEERAKRAEKIKKGEEVEDEPENENDKKEVNQELVDWEEKFLSRIEISEGQDVEFDLSVISKVNKDLSIDTNDRPSSSYGCFIQLMEVEGELKTFVNTSFSGYGKMVSRFLHILDEKITDSIRDWNSELIGENELYLENCDASYFNANLHPPLMPNEIWMPGGHNSLAEDFQIPILDFSVRLKDGVLNLIHKPTGKEASVFDLGFQAHAGRSQLFQLLDKFTKADYSSAYHILNLINKKYNDLNRKEVGENEKKELEISVSPRVVISDLIFQRKTWYAPKALLPEKTSMDEPYDYFVKVSQWQKENGLPNEVFIYVDPYRGAKVDPELGKKLTRDDYKPQYIDFRQPLLVNLFDKLVQKTPMTMKVVEMLPTSDQMLKVDGKRFVTEFVTQWYN